MNICTCTLITIWFIANHPIIIVIANCISNGQCQVIPDIVQLMRWSNITFFIRTLLEYWNKIIIELNKWFRNDIIDLAANAFECEFIAGSILGSIRLNDRFTNTFASFVIVYCSVNIPSFIENILRILKCMQTYR